MRLAAGLRRVGGSDIVNSYLVIDERGVTVIDAGLPGDWRDLQAELGAAGRSLADVRGVVLTHGDTDHIGYAERLRRERGVPIHVHEADAARARGEVKKGNVALGKVRVRPLLRFLWYAGRRGGLRIAPVREVVTFQPGETLADLPGSPQIIGMPGHTPGSVAVHVPAVDALFIGDALTTENVLTGARGPRPAPFTLDQEAAKASVANLASVPATWVLPGHGPAWNGGTADAVRHYLAAVR